MEEYIIKYLEHIQSDRFDYEVKMVPCEVCGRMEFTVVREEISLGQGVYGKYPVQACNHCGFLMHNPRFEKTFYQDFYRKYYRRMTHHNTKPMHEFVENQVVRANNMIDYLKDYLPERGAVLDVGSSSGGFLIPFRDMGWDVYGNDPDKEHVEYGINELKLPIEFIDAEEMQLEPNSFDLIIIMGSLEHVYDPNIILKKCRQASKEGGLLVLEGRFRPLGLSKNFFNHNHHRYLRKTHIQLMMIKHGWQPFIATDDPVCGVNVQREGNGYCVGRAITIPTQSELDVVIEGGLKDVPSETIKEFDDFDAQIHLHTSKEIT